MSTTSDSTSVLTINKWIIDLADIDINTLHPKIQCKFLMAIEDSVFFTKLIKMVQFYSGILTGAKLVTISLSDIYDFLRYKGSSPLYWDNNFIELVTAAYNDAFVYVQMEKQIPVDLLVKLIKLKIIAVIKEIIFLQRKETILRQQKNYYKPSVLEGDSKGKTKGKGKGKQDKSDKLNTSKSKKGKKVEDQTTTCENYEYNLAEEILPDENLDISGAFIYIVLVGFYNSSLIPFCHWHGIPLTCVIKYGEAKIKFSKFSSQTSLDSINFRDDVLTLPDKYLAMSQLYKKKEYIISNFWQKVNIMYKTEKSPYIDDSFIMIYTPLLFIVAKRNSKLYFHQCEQLYEDFLEFVQKLEDYQQQYNTYLESLELYKLDKEPKKVEIQQLQSYQSALDALPIDIISVSLILDNLINEICNEYEVPGELNNQKTTIDVTEERNLSKQSHHLSEDLVCHRSLRDQLKNIFNHFKFVGSTCLTTSVPSSNKLKSINNKPYIIHENNFIEMTLNYYKYLPNTVLDTIVTYLKKSPCINAFINFPQLKDSVVARNKTEIREWCTLLEIDELELYICLTTILMGMFMFPEEADLARESPNRNERIPIEKITHEIQASIPKREQKKRANEINAYEKINPFDLKWVDRLPPLVILQELAKAAEEYEAVDRKYVELFDSMVYRFHHDVDEFGIVTKFWKKDIRTHVNFHDFMTYVLYRDFDVITEQHENFKKEEILLECVQNAINNLGDFSVCAEDFMLPGSLKDKYIHKMPSEIDLDTQGKGKKNATQKHDKKSTMNKGSSKSAKSTSTKNSKGTKKDNTIDVRAVVEDEPFKIDLEDVNVYRNLLPHDSPKKLNAIDFDGLLLTCSGISTSFYSLDDFKIIVDQIQMRDREPTLSIKVGLNHHDLIVHRTSKGGFSFLVNFKSGVVLACGRSTFHPSETDTNLYLMREESEKIISCMRSLFNTKKNIIITEKKFKEILKLNKKDLKKELDSKSVNSVTAVAQKSHPKESKGSVSNGRRSSAKQPSTQSLARSRRSIESKLSMQETGSFSVKGFVNEIKLLKKMFSTLTPKFKVYSSKLHKYDFIKRIVSPIELNLNEIIRFVIRAKRENKRLLTVKKRYNLKSELKIVKQLYEYDFRITLPSGLHLRNIVGEQGPCLCQYYFQKQVVCSPIHDEDCRLFLGKGTIAVKKNNGTFVIYAANGEIIKYETLLAESTYGNNKVKRNMNCPKAMTRFLKHIRRNVYKLTKGHKGTENFMSSRRTGKREVKRYKCTNQKHTFSNIKFSFTTSEGKVLLYKNGLLTECEAYYVEKEDVLKSGQVIFYREDGTTSILTDEGHMQTIFDDGTKITVWCEIDAKPVTIDLRDQFGSDCEDMGSFVKIITCCQYEHPYYVTVLTSGADEKLMLRIATGEIFDISSTHFLVGIDESTTLLANKEMLRFVGTPCNECSKYCECDVYINQLYDPPPDINNEQLLLKASDTYEKSFLVHYDGSIERNEEYIHERRCNHASHKIQPSQAFFSLNRDLNGCMFWTDENYNIRLSEATDPATDYVVFYIDRTTQKILTTEWKTFVKQHHNFRFIWPEIKSGSNDIDEYDISSAAFVKQRIVKRISNNLVANLISIITQKAGIFSDSFTSTLNMKSSSTESLSPASSEEFRIAQRAHAKRKLAYEKKMNKRNMECMSVIDKIIEYFVTKTGRYYRSKVYEDFCGVKLMLDDEEEIFFLANFDNSTHTVSSFEDISDSNADLCKTKNLSPSSEMIKSKLSKSTSAVDTALEVIKQIELEKQKGYFDQKQSEEQRTIQSKGVISKPKSLLRTSSIVKSSQLAVVDGPKYVPVVCSVDENVLKQKSSLSQSKLLKKSSTFKRDTEEFAHQRSISFFQCDSEMNNEDMLSEETDQKVNKAKDISENTKSSDSVDDSLNNEEDVLIMLKGISDTLKRIKREKFSYYIESRSNDSQMDSESLCVKTNDEENESRLNSPRTLDRLTFDENVIVQDLFYVPRHKIHTCGSDYQSIETAVRDSEYLDKCYSNFSFKDTGMADCLGELDTTGDTNITDKEKEDMEHEQELNLNKEEVLPGSMAPISGISSYSDRFINAASYEKYCLKIIHESGTCQISDSSSLQGSLDMRSAFVLESTPSMVPLVNVQSLTQHHSNLEVAPTLSSLISLQGVHGKTASMKVLRSTSQFEEEFEFVVAKNDGIVTDKYKTQEVQTDIYEDVDDCSTN